MILFQSHFHCLVPVIFQLLLGASNVLAQVMEKSPSTEIEKNTNIEETSRNSVKQSSTSTQSRKRRLPSSYSVGALKCVGVLPGVGNCNSSSSDESSSDDEISVKSEVVRWKSFVCGQSGKVFVDSLGRKLQFAPATKKN